MSGTHSILSPSGWKKWMSCPPSARLEEHLPDMTSEAAAEGTAAHALAEYRLQAALGLPIGNAPVSKYDCAEMVGHVDEYVSYVMELMEGLQRTSNPKIFTERRVSLIRWVPECAGTCDCAIVSGTQLHIVDLKYGKGVLVPVEGNAQLRMYALGMLDSLDSLYDIETVSMTIFQPRRAYVETETMSVSELLAWAEATLKPVADKAYTGGGDFSSGEHCRFCRAAPQCRARAEAQMLLARDEFALPPLLTNEEIGVILPQLDGLIHWANSLKDYALEAAVSGVSWPGFKLVEGRSIRRYVDEERVADAALSAGYTEIYKHALLSVTEMEKLLGKKKFTELLGPLVIKPQGKPTLVSDSDKRSVIHGDEFKGEYND